jgi:hypothetical protein
MKSPETVADVVDELDAIIHKLQRLVGVLLRLRGQLMREQEGD